MKKLFKSLFVDLFFGWSLPQVLWLIFSQVSLFYFSILWDDAPHALIAAQAGMLYTILAGKGKAACFLFGIINTPLYAYISYVHGYYGDFALNVYYFFMMFIGLNAWLRNASQSAVEGIVRTQLSNKGRCILLGVCFLLTFVLYCILKGIGGTRPICDALTNVLSIAAMYLTIKRAIEEWVLWIAVNAIEVFMWGNIVLSGDGMISVLLMWVIFLLNGIFIFVNWLRISRGKLSSLSLKW